MAISRVAYLSVCNHCHQHACVVLPSGRHTNEFVTKKEGSEEVDRLFAHRDIAADEAAFLKDQIWDSSLPEEKAPRLLDAFLLIHEDVELYPFGRSSATDDEEESPTLH